MRTTTPFGLLIALFLIQSGSVRAEEHFQVTRLAPDLLMLGTDQGSYTNNSLVFTGPDGVLLVDTHTDEDADALREFVLALGFGPPRFIINTHRHQEHIGGNASFGSEPVGIAHDLFPGKLRSGTYLFNEYPDESLPELTFADSMLVHFNGEVIRLVAIGGSHDDNEILVHFTGHGIAHASSVVNGFNFPSVDAAGDVTQFEVRTRDLMNLLPPDTQIVSGHNGGSAGFDFVGRWEQLSDYADMMRDTIAAVRAGLDAGETVEELQERDALAGYEHYAGSYVSANGWIAMIAEALSAPEAPERQDICRPVYDAWKSGGAQAAVDLYRRLEQADPEAYDFDEVMLLAMGSRLYGRGLYADACTFLEGSADIYPDAQYGYYTHYLLAKSLQAMDRLAEAREHCAESVRLNGDFAAATGLLEELEGDSGGR